MKNLLFPVPRSIRQFKSSTTVTGPLWVILPESSSARLQARALELVHSWQPSCNYPIRMSKATPGRSATEVRIQTGVRGIGRESYSLSITKELIELRAGDDAGAFYGLSALGQIITLSSNRIPHCIIKDRPDFPARGVMLDVSRCKVPTMETLKLLIDRLASVRINQLQLYIEHTFAFSAHSTVWKDASPFTHEEIMELDVYCHDRFIELVPNLNSFGHVERWLRHPAYKHLAECPDGLELPSGRKMNHGSTLIPRKASLDFLNGLYSEYLPNFSSTLFNVGCDETYQLGRGKSKRRCEAIGTTRVYLEFLTKIHELVTRHNRRMMFWGDIILHKPELIKKLPKDVIALNWGYESNHPFSHQTRQFARAEIPFYVCPGTSSWNSLTGRTRNCIGNLENAARNGLKNGAIGFLNTDWGDHGHHQVLPVAYLGYCAGAAFSWCLKSNRKVDLAHAVSRFFLDDQTGVSGKLFYQLGETNDYFRRTPFNATTIGRLLLWNLDPETIPVEGVTRSSLNRCLTTFDRLERQLKKAKPAGQDRDLVLDEFRHTLNLCRHVVHRALVGIQGKRVPKGLIVELRKAIKSHQTQWLKRNRPGGLRESTDYLQKVLRSLTNR